MQKYYKILNLSQSADLSDLENARNKLLKIYHPDLYKGNKSYAVSETKKILEAYEEIKKIITLRNNKENKSSNTNIKFNVSSKSYTMEKNYEQFGYKFDRKEESETFWEKYQIPIIIFFTFASIKALVILNHNNFFD
jgi:curved DNA-binding protein CbpA